MKGLKLFGALVGAGGLPGEGDNVLATVEDVQVTGPGNASVTGSSVFNFAHHGRGRRCHHEPRRRR